VFERVLIANRGAIAARIARTLAAAGVESVGVFAEADRGSVHHRACDHAFSLGDGGARETYLDAARLLDIAARSGAGAVHPGYGFLSENAAFARACEARGLVFLGPTAAQIEAFGLKHEARRLAQQCGVPLLPGSGLLASGEAARAEAARVGYPVMLKSTAGGGGIGMQRCDDGPAVEAAFESVTRLAGSNFADGGVFVEKFIERARHVEVQVFGDGAGAVVALGERDCSAQRRHQKVLEETPAPRLPAAVRTAMAEAAVRLCRAVDYRSAGTVEFVYDDAAGRFYFLEVNTRLQVEHGVTEAVFGVDLVDWMLHLGAGTLAPLADLAVGLAPRGHAIQARIYAEDPARDFRPSSGRLSQVAFPEGDGLRVERAVDSGSEVSAHFDPMLAKVIVHGADRAAAVAGLARALDETRLHGLETNLRYLRQLVADRAVVAGEVTTASLAAFSYRPASVEVVSAGTMTTIQDAHGRRGYWHVGVPPSGAFDRRSFALGNRLLGNDPNAAGLEIAIGGPRLRFDAGVSIVLAGAAVPATLDGEPVPGWTTVDVPAGSTLAIGAIPGPGARVYLLVAGGIDCPEYLSSRSTFTLGRFGGHGGRQLVAGDVLHLASPGLRPAARLDDALLPRWSGHWRLRVIYGPHGAPDFFTPEGMEAFFAHDWEVHYNSSRTGIRLVGPKPGWARPDGGEAGLHPSNIHDNAYAFGSVDFTGDMPVILGPDGPSLGGFVCPATVVDADLWKLGQLRAGDSVRLETITLADAGALARAEGAVVETLSPRPVAISARGPGSPVLRRRPGDRGAPAVTYRAAGDRFVLIEYGENLLDVALRLRVDALMRWLAANPRRGTTELTPGIRSLQVHFDPQTIPHDALLDHLAAGEDALGSLEDATVPSRIVHLPLSWNDPACDKAIAHYDRAVRPDAPWAPSNIEFIRRINGLGSVDEVKRIVFDASYLVMGLGDVYLGAPVATPLDPRHRLVTTKYNPARTWTAENSVGIGGAYLCVYGMEGPGGYQLVGRTVQMWNRFHQTDDFSEPWLLRFFDQIRFHEVSAAELERMREAFARGDWHVEVEHGEFSLSDYRRFLADNAAAIGAFETRRRQAFDDELRHWRESGQLHYDSTPQATAVGGPEPVALPPGFEAVESPVAGTLWKWLLTADATVSEGTAIAIVEAMKTEILLTAPCAGRLRSLHVDAGGPVSTGQVLAVIEPG